MRSESGSSPTAPAEWGRQLIARSGGRAVGPAAEGLRRWGTAAPTEPAGQAPSGAALVCVVFPEATLVRTNSGPPLYQGSKGGLNPVFVARFAVEGKQPTIHVDRWRIGALEVYFVGLNGALRPPQVRLNCRPGPVRVVGVGEVVEKLLVGAEGCGRVPSSPLHFGEAPVGRRARRSLRLGPPRIEEGGGEGALGLMRVGEG